MHYEILKLREHSELIEQSAEWFHTKWNIPLDAYLDSINKCVENSAAVPQWYVAINHENIIGGLGVIENDFHDRKDLAPNVCAVYVEEAYRCQKIAGQLLNVVCTDMNAMGIDSSEEPVIAHTAQPSDSGRPIPGSMAFVPSVAGLLIAGEVVRDLIGKVT